MRSLVKWRVLVAVVAMGCGEDVDLGGSVDGSVTPTIDGATSTDCTPCVTIADCAKGAACAEVAGDLYCASFCQDKDDCTPGEDCETLDEPDGGTTKACAPSSGTCPPASTVTLSDGAAATECGTLVGPNVTAQCHACGASSTECQANGCYGGYWCDTSSRDCKEPPQTCN